MTGQSLVTFWLCNRLEDFYRFFFLLGSLFLLLVAELFLC